jgi:pimeloyl-ACP methyl ester carboxylesterase
VSAGGRVVLVHGAIEQASGFSRVLPHLDGLDVTAYDRKGHGSRWQEGPGALESDIAELLEVVAETPATVVGHSIGGLVVLGASLRRPHVFASLGTFETAIPWADWWTEPERASMRDQTEANLAANMASESDERERLQVAWETCLREVLDALAAPFRWQDVSVPLTTGRGGASDGYSARDATLVADHFGAEVVVLEGAGHRAHRSDPAGFAAFVRTCVGAGAAPARRETAASPSRENGAHNVRSW